MKLVIAEKPSVAMALASVIGARTRKDGYVEGNGYLVSWCVGHLVGLCDASEYDEKYKKWRYEDLPIVPECWKHRVLEGTKKQFGILKKLMRDSKVDEVICATDAGREGELIFRLVYEQAGCKKPMKRLWISSMEEQAIKDGFASLKDGSCYDSLYQSALCRAKADWLVGINASRLFSVLYNQNLKVGRVQTPTLAMIVDRNQKIKEFTKEKYYMAHIKFDEMDAVTEHFQKKEDADRVAADCMERMCEVEKDDVKEKTVRPPKLYDLTTLQREANRMFGYTAQQTLDAVQEMYEQKLVTYPRTDSQYLTDEMGESTETLIQMLLGKMPYAEGLEYHPDVSKVLNSKKVSDHHAIIPTMEVAKADIGELKERNRKILYLISARVLTATADPYIYESHKCQMEDWRKLRQKSRQKGRIQSQRVRREILLQHYKVKRKRWLMGTVQSSPQFFEVGGEKNMDWCLYGEDKRREIDRDLKPEYLLDDLRRYQDVFGEEFGVKELLMLEDIRVKAMIAGALADMPEFLVDQIGKANNSSSFPSVTRAMERIADVVEEKWEEERE